jgi:hypothetical protein
VDDEDELALPATSRAHVVDEPILEENSCASSSVALDATLAEKVTVIVELPVVVTVPSHTSVSPPSAVVEDIFAHVDPPPLMDETVAPVEKTPTDSTMASPTC